MGRYSSVQAYADNNTNTRVVPYEQATGGGAAPKPVKAEKVTNPYGSTAGAGSGEFHVYRHARAREIERWKTLDEEEREHLMRQDFEKQLETNKMEEEGKTAKRRKKRQRQKEAKMRKKNLKLSGILADVDDEKDTNLDDDEFTYEPDHGRANDEEKNAEKSDDAEESKETSKLPFANDGSFLEQMKHRLEEESIQNGVESDDEESRLKKKRAT
jgi:hypothetical protein